MIKGYAPQSCFWSTCLIKMKKASKSTKSAYLTFVNASVPFLYAVAGYVRVVFQLTGRDPKILSGN